MAYRILAMTRDMDLFREILLEVEKLPAGRPWPATPLLGHEIESVVSHVLLLRDAALVDATNLQYHAAMVRRITNQGYDFIEASKQPSLWSRAKEQVKNLALPVTAATMKAVLDALVKEHLHVHLPGN